jgi:hypothetical protein
MRTGPVRITAYGTGMFSYGSEELAHHRHRELLDTATYIRNARRARDRARRAAATGGRAPAIASRGDGLGGAEARRGRGRGWAGWLTRLVRRGRPQPAVVPVPPKPAHVLRAHATVPADGDGGPPNPPADDDLLLAS